MKIRAFCEIRGVPCRHFLKCSVNKMAATGSFFFIVSCVVRRFSLLQRGVEPQMTRSLKAMLLVLARYDTVDRYYLLARTPIMQYPGTVVEN